jgi:hypothetical protein
MMKTTIQPDDPLLDAPIDEIEYRSVSALAVVAFALGILSLLALISPVLWIVPVAAVAVALIAIRVIKNDPQKSGQRLATIGLFVAVCVGIWAVSYHFSREWYLFHKARQFADDWLAVVQDGNLYEAHQLHLPYVDRFEDKDKLAEYYDSLVDVEDSVTEFFGEKPLDEFVENASRGKVEYVGGTSHTTFGKSDFLTLKYVLKYGDNELVLNIQLERILNYGDGRHYWRIEAVAP